MGAIQLLDGLAALPLEARTRERIEWLADEVVDAGGMATVWLATPAAVAQGREIAQKMALSIAAEYRRVTENARAAQSEGPATRRRSLRLLRRELHRIGERDYFPPPEREEAHAAVDALATSAEVSR